MWTQRGAILYIITISHAYVIIIGVFTYIISILSKKLHTLYVEVWCIISKPDVELIK